jgi:hypothetical protein
VVNSLNHSSNHIFTPHDALSCSAGKVTSVSKARPAGNFLEAVLEPIKTFGGVVSETQLEAATGAAIDDSEWTKVVNSVDVVGHSATPHIARHIIGCHSTPYS